MLELVKRLKNFLHDEIICMNSVPTLLFSKTHFRARSGQSDGGVSTVSADSQDSVTVGYPEAKPSNGS